MCKMTPCYRGLHVRRLTSRIAISSRKCQRRITINKAVSTTSVSPTGKQGEGHNVRHFSMVIMGLPAQLSAKFDTASHDARNPHEWSSKNHTFPKVVTGSPFLIWCINASESPIMKNINGWFSI